MLREYQEQAVNGIKASLRSGHKHPLMVAPTGSGKSVIFGEIIERSVKSGSQVLWLVHRRNLVLQMRDTLRNMYGIEPGIIMAGYEPNKEAPVQVGTIQTYSKRINSDKLFNPDFFEADVVLFDEAHRSISPTYKKVTDKYQDKIMIGCTATPLRADGRGLGEVYDDIIEVSNVPELVADGFLSPARYFAPTTIDTTGIGTAGGDFVLRELAERVDNKGITGDIVQNWLKLAEDRKTIVFCVNVAHSMSVRDAFLEAGVTCQHLDARSSDETREGVFSSMERGHTKIVCNVALYQEGMDVPGISCIVMGRPTKSMGLWRQCLGRGFRILEGKQDCLILDHGGNIDRLGFADDPITWTLSEKEIGWTQPKPKDEDPKKVECRGCGLVFMGSSVCPDCGTAVKSFGKPVQTVEAELVELKAKEKKSNNNLPWGYKINFMRMLQHYENKKNWHPGRKAHLYRLFFNVWPNDPRLKNVEPMLPSGEINNKIKYVMIKSAKAYQKKQRGKIS